MSVSEQEAVREALQAMVAPLHDEMRKVDALIESTSAQLHELRATRHAIQNVLKQLDPSSSTPVKRKRGFAPRGTRAPEILAFIESHNGDYVDGIIFTKLFQAMKAEGVAIGKDKVKEAVLELHEQGVLRLDRKTMGGGNSYKLVGDGD